MSFDLEKYSISCLSFFWNIFVPKVFRFGTKIQTLCICEMQQEKSSLIRFLGLFCLRFVRRLQGDLPLSFFSRWDKIYYSS